MYSTMYMLYSTTILDLNFREFQDQMTHPIIAEKCS